MALLDETILHDLISEIDDDTISLLIQGFIDEIDARLVRISDTMTGQDLCNLSNEVHAMKSVSGTFGAVDLFEVAKTIETKCKTNDTADMETICSQIKTIGAETLSVYKTYLSNRKLAS